MSRHKRPDTKKYAFFSHKECEYFPCHRTSDPDNFNCLFCYCPLYVLGDKCGGNFRFTEKGVKDCTGCLFPHKRENFEKVTARYKDIAAAMDAFNRERLSKESPEKADEGEDHE
ncbi:MAG: cysteine-rich small domain-containing protein [Eubacterium sp.]|nr:cysteine-rich small domain-containing protein [Eubacterium sp.]